MQEWVTEQYGDVENFDFYAVNVSENQNLVAQYVEQIGLEIPVIMVGNDVYNQYRIRGGVSPYPVDYIIDQEGIVRYAQHEYEPEFMQMILDRLLVQDEQNPVLELSADTLNFGKTNIGESVDLPVLIRNLGDADLEVLNFEIDNEYFLVNFEEEFNISPADSVGIIFTFNPSDSNAVGDISGIATVTSNDPEREEIDIQLFGMGIPVNNVEQKFEREIPIAFHLNEVYPNPFNSETIITFGLPYTTRVEIQMFNTNGKYSYSVFAGQLNTGLHQVTWNALDAPTGVYIIKMQAENYQGFRKVTLIR